MLVLGCAVLLSSPLAPRLASVLCSSRDATCLCHVRHTTAACRQRASAAQRRVFRGKTCQRGRPAAPPIATRSVSLCVCQSVSVSLCLSVSAFCVCLSACVCLRASFGTLDRARAEPAISMSLPLSSLPVSSPPLCRSVSLLSPLYLSTSDSSSAFSPSVILVGV